jgi:glutathione S-transferase
MILYGSSLSPFVRKVLAAAHEKGIALDLRPTRIADGDPDFRAASPFGKMPAFADGDYKLCDSSAIVHYLDAKQPEPPLIPADPKLRGKAVWFDEFADTILFDCGRKIFFNRIVAPFFMGRPGDEAAAATAEQDELPPILDYLETVAPEGEGFLLGEAISLADIAVASPFANFRHLGIVLDASRHPRTGRYVERMLARPSFASSIEREQAFLDKTGVPRKENAAPPGGSAASSLSVSGA